MHKHITTHPIQSLQKVEVLALRIQPLHRVALEVTDLKLLDCRPRDKLSV